MRTTLFLAIVSLILLGPSSLVLAQGFSITESIELHDHNLVLRVLREGNGDDPTFCTSRRLVECGGLTTPAPPVALGVDSSGAVYHWVGMEGGIGIIFGGGKSGAALQRTLPSGAVEDVLYLFRRICFSGSDSDCSTNLRLSEMHEPTLDVTNGRILIPIWAQECPTSSCNLYSGGIVEIDGLPTMFDTLLTFIPGQQALNILTPAHPDGFRSADSVQVWTGNVRSMPDWSQAQPLTCEAAANPVPGQLVSVPDTLPDPDVGEGRYYLVASHSGADRRLGRQFVNGAFSARVPTGLPVCQ